MTLTLDMQLAFAQVRGRPSTKAVAGAISTKIVSRMAVDVGPRFSKGRVVLKIRSRRANRRMKDEAFELEPNHLKVGAGLANR